VNSDLQNPLIGHGKRVPRHDFASYPDATTTRAKEVREMLESCYCGRTGEIEDREPVTTEDGKRALRCPECGHLDSLDWLPKEAGRRAFEEAERRQPKAA
jgi:hypothetical protein